jgi:hypothetical protein
MGRRELGSEGVGRYSFFFFVTFFFFLRREGGARERGKKGKTFCEAEKAYVAVYPFAMWFGTRLARVKLTLNRAPDSEGSFWIGAWPHGGETVPYKFTVLPGAKGASRFAMPKAYKSYMDETGIQSNDPWCAIAGYVADANEWARFDRQWNWVIEEYCRWPGEKYFHALEFYGNHAKYRSWKLARRESFINALYDTIRDFHIALFSSAVDVPTFKAFTEDERRYLTGGWHNGMRWKSEGAPSKPYFLPFHHCIIQSAAHVPPDGLLYPIMSRQDQYEMKGLELYEQLLNSKPSLQCRAKLADEMVFSNPKKVGGLQAADLAAYWMGQSMRYRARTGDRKLLKYEHRVEIGKLLRNVFGKDAMKMFDFQGMMLVLGGINRYIKTSLQTRDQTRPSLPIQQRREVLGAMRKVNFRRFLDQWTPTAQAGHD